MGPTSPWVSKIGALFTNLQMDLQVICRIFTGQVVDLHENLQHLQVFSHTHTYARTYARAYIRARAHTHTCLHRRKPVNVVKTSTPSRSVRIFMCK